MKLGVLARMLDLRPRGLRGLASVDDFERAANRKLPRIISDFVSGGSDCETTVQKNLSAFDQIEWAPRYLSDVSDRWVSTEVFGVPLKLGVMLSPAGLASLVHRDGELAAAKAAAHALGIDDKCRELLAKLVFCRVAYDHSPRRFRVPLR